MSDSQQRCEINTLATADGFLVAQARQENPIPLPPDAIFYAKLLIQKGLIFLAWYLRKGVDGGASCRLLIVMRG
jgi:hypothetical protein